MALFNASRTESDWVWLDGQPVAQFTDSYDAAGTYQGTTVTYLYADHLGTPRIGTDASKAITWRYPSDAFGVGTPSGTASVRLRLPGQIDLGILGIGYNYFRDYDPQVGRYLESDPIGIDGGLNTYAYVGGNPVSYTDPLGLAFGINMGECYGEEAAQYWADKAAETGNPLYHIPGAVASLWTRDTSNKTAIVLGAAYLARNAVSTWSLRDGSQGYTPIDAGNLLRVERHMTGSAKAGNRAMTWHSHVGGSGHLPPAVGIGVTSGLVGLAAAAWNGDIGKNDFKCGCGK